MIDPRDARIAELEAIVTRQQAMIERLTVQVAVVAKLEARIEELEAKLRQTSANSNRPPSTDSPSDRAQRREPPKHAGGRRRGGQPGHEGNRRTLLPAEQVDTVVDCYPSRCGACRRRLRRRRDPAPVRHQVTEVPPVQPHTTEYRLHAATCGCGHTTRGELPQGVAPSPFGPRLAAIMALLTGAYRLSRRMAVAMLRDLLGVCVSLGGVSNNESRVSEALAAPYREAEARARDAPIKHVDATSWRQGGAWRNVWTIATTMVSVFAITTDGTARTVRALLGKLKGILVSDRATAFGFWAIERRQVCWAHLLRKFVSFAELKDGAGPMGRELLDWTGIFFGWWQEVRDGKLPRREFRRRMVDVRHRIEYLLRKARRLRLPGMAGSCADILEHRKALWTFVDRRGVEPTNNHAERELRGVVLWRKTSLGTQSDRGNRFVERMATVVATLRKQKRNVLSYLVAAVQNAAHHRSAPPLLPAHA